jgi:hypothetical protein
MVNTNDENELIKKLKECGIEQYPDAWEGFKSIVKVVANFVPVTAALAKLLDEKERYMQSANLFTFFTQLEIELDSLKNRLEKNEDRAQINEQLVPTKEEIITLIGTTLKHIRFEESHEKIRLFTRVLSNSLLDYQDYDLDDKTSCLQYCNELSIKDIQILVIIAKNHIVSVDNIYQLYQKEMDESEKKEKPIFRKFYKMGMDDLGKTITSISKLESRGLIGESFSTKQNLNESGYDSWQNRWQNKKYEVLPFGKFLANQFLPADQKIKDPKSKLSKFFEKDETMNN